MSEETVSGGAPTQPGGEKKKGLGTLRLGGDRMWCSDSDFIRRRCRSVAGSRPRRSKR